MSELKLIEAVKAGNRKEVERLIESGAEVNQADEQGWTPLSFAAGSGDLELVKLLSEKGADVFNAGRDLRTPYKIALAAGQEEVARFLRDIEKSSPQQVPDHPGREYCKAYFLGDLRKFPGWSESRINWKAKGHSLDNGKADQGFNEETIVYLHQDFTVTESMWHNENVIFNDVTAEWEAFCRDALQFKVPDDFDLMATSRSAD